ncbi:MULTISPECIES: glycosyltransferase 87 family protein [unclassified Parafrankia]|uniref:glycosyltransferase 87 family protein n=1 Tax=unclassified Parafrankia TaxID=2994368 RepID=UPI000DA5A76D|nr:MULTISPECIES: glycosyltransferase 87 family protein [unclassified Parafrankia]SQD98636.1 Sugar transporter superfamily protein [Parafrankia sp. Ea1.12]
MNLAPQPRRLQAAARTTGTATGLGFAVLFLTFAVTSRLTDLVVYRLGGNVLLHGGDLYSAVEPASGLPFTYTPFAAAVFTPLALPPRPVAQLVWTLLLLVSLYFFCATSLAAIRPSPAGRWPGVRAVGPVVGLAMLAEPIRRNFDLGQINIALGLLVALDLFGRRGPLPRGVLIGIAAGIKLTPLIFVPHLLLTGRHRAALTAVATFGVTIGVGFAASPGSSATYWSETFLDPGHVGGVPFAGNQSLLGVLARLMSGADNARPLYLPLAAVVAAVGLATAARLFRSGARLPGDVTCALTGLLVSPISWSHHWVWAVPALLWMSAAPGRPRWGRGAAVAGYGLLVAAPIWWVPNTGDAEFSHHGWQLLAGNCYFLAALLLLGALAAWALTGARGGPRAPVPRLPDQRIVGRRVPGPRVPDPRRRSGDVAGALPGGE